MRGVFCVSRKTLFIGSVIILFMIIGIGYIRISNTLLSRRASTVTRASTVESNTAIINGRKALENEFPYFVKLTSESTPCGGVLIGDTYVLTAAHCVYGTYKKGGKVDVLIGVNDYGNYPLIGHYHAIVYHNEIDKNIFIPKNYSEEGWREITELTRPIFDIALVKLPSKVINVPTLSFPGDFFDVYQENIEKVSIMGVGVTELSGSEISWDLLATDVNLASFPFRSTSFICVHANISAGQGIGSSGDSGGPAVVSIKNKLYVVGVYSRFVPGLGIGCYSSTAYYSKWISEVSGVDTYWGTAGDNISLYPTPHPLDN